MPDKRSIEAALKSLYQTDGDLSGEPPPRRKQRASRKPKSGLRHDRKCSVCRNPERAEIEREFLHWRSPELIANAQRATHIRLALAPLIEQAMVVPVTADSIVRAVALYARLNDEGQWIDPPKDVIYHSADLRQPAPPKAETTKPNRESASTLP